jgi:hypothetical protein
MTISNSKLLVYQRVTMSFSCRNKRSFRTVFLRKVKSHHWYDVSGWPDQLQTLTSLRQKKTTCFVDPINALWCWYIYLHNCAIFGVNVGKYSIHGAFGDVCRINTKNHLKTKQKIFMSLPFLLTIIYSEKNIRRQPDKLQQHKGQ